MGDANFTLGAVRPGCRDRSCDPPAIRSPMRGDSHLDRG
jgi:hypothetical protein